MSEKVYPPLDEGQPHPQAPPYPPPGDASATPNVPLAPPPYDQSQATPAVPLAPYPGQPAGPPPSVPLAPGGGAAVPPHGQVAIPMAPAPGQSLPASHAALGRNVIVGPEYREHSLAVTCPTCKAEVSTSVREDVGPGAWIFCLAMFCAGCFLFAVTWCFCCIPWCLPQFKTFEHTCPSCKAKLGTYKGPFAMN